MAEGAAWGNGDGAGAGASCHLKTAPRVALGPLRVRAKEKAAVFADDGPFAASPSARSGEVGP